ncbi:tannase/feruloyl esterase family alpha/beta hydrolase (plasmid) [Rhizobium leguminosarum]|jgi:feruloyl esterase|uniref:Tannase/feruloyl esterase family alpha/beta hydrolase n=1 Tax=Rhizobium leguminosarum TaxID=384 RepID=A0A7M3DTM3_RHILE|nr:tannase/feruloyl esterase family alpha/beta hydrolase [Rhizobium leguminosarum]MBP2490821.1 feruloyl esterase [Rhizobium leguminosarum]MBY5475685.1 tannase/feruloyl esterase family alpha/beta hydrolase [Rhizobium leguminosarum]MBY5496836.1 tannase/feruloyl esterase family alpha/beta hydrolase [Rhizobium leguminosarum]MBY5510759.1 tannase/feruloyl esterase family alpha/beta hydrolase [Rhizobium leguminosarum]MBY5517746.1 tannase/feruloyl esterase family alpha/beta hydrolase [Rhizobium legumi
MALAPAHAEDRIGAEIAPRPVACAALSQATLPNASIELAEWHRPQVLAPDGTSAITGSTNKNSQVGALCLVRGVINARAGVNGKGYGIGFELRLPEAWNSKFLFQGGGGTDGFLAPALGSIPFQGSTAAPALVRGYAVVSQDGGHQATDTSFAQDQQARLDYAYGSTGQVTSVAKQLINLFYGAHPRKSYFMGCSNGGREAMMAAQRYPTEFDGIVAGNPGFRLSYAAVGEAWDSQQFMRVAPVNALGEKIVANAFTPRELDLVSQAITQQCDGWDGLKDGVINGWEQCDFRPVTLQCQPGSTKECLSEAKVGVLQTVFAGAKNSRGENVYASWPWDAAINTPGWRMWKLGTSQTGKPNAIAFTMGAAALRDYFMTPYNPDFDVLAFDFDHDVARISQTAAINDADATFLTTYAQLGGKLLIVQGVSDPVFSANDIRDWYRRLQRDMGAQTSNFARLFMVPGMTHCGGGSALEDIDPLSALEEWTDRGVAPAQMIGKGVLLGDTRQRSQPICAYPQTAIYKGGDERSAASFICH